MNRSFLLILFLIGFINGISAQSFFEKESFSNDSLKQDPLLNLDGQLKSSIFALSKNFDYTTIQAECRLEAKWNFKNVSIYSESKIRSGYAYDDAFTDLSLREAYVTYSDNRKYISLGNKIIQWGKTDGFNPTNNLNPIDYFYNTSKQNEQFMGNFMLEASYRFNPNLKIEFIGIPIYKNSRYRFDLIMNDENIRFLDKQMPPVKIENGAIVGKICADYSHFSMSLSCFSGYDPFCSFQVANILFQEERPKIDFQLTPFHKTVIGGDFEIGLKTFLVRGEMAYNHTKNSKNNIHIPNPSFSYVLNLEKTIFGWNTIFQYIGQSSFRFSQIDEPILNNPEDPLMMLKYMEECVLHDAAIFNRKLFHQEEKFNHACSIHFSKSFLFDNLTTQFSAFYDFTSNEYLLRPTLKWKVTDGLEMDMGWNHMQGPDNSIFSLAAPVLNNGFLELTVSF